MTGPAATDLERTKPPGAPEAAARLELAAVHRVCVQLGMHEAIANHLSLRIPGEPDQMLLSPFPLHWSEVTASSLMRVRVSDGSVLQGDHQVEPTAWFIHGSLQRGHPRHTCFLHTHMPWATAISCRESGRLEPVHQHLIGLYHDIAYYDEYHGEVLDQPHGDAIAAAMGDRSILFLANHGIVTAGNSVATAFDRLYYIERACQFQILAESGGRPLKRLDKALLEAPTRKADPESFGYAEKHFAAWRRILDRKDPGYAD